MKLLLYIQLALCLLSPSSYAQTIGTPPNVTGIVGAFNFTEVDRLLQSGSSAPSTSAAVTLNMTRVASPQDIISSTIGSFNFTEFGVAVSSVAPMSTIGGSFQFTDIGGVAANTLIGIYTGTLLMDPNASYKVNLGQITMGTGIYAGASGPILFNTSRVSSLATVLDTTYTSSGFTTFLASIQTAWP